MKRFRFKLEGLLRVRSEEEKRAQRRVAALLAQQRTLEEMLRALQEQLQSTRTGLRSALTGRVDLVEFRQHTTVAIHMRRRADEIVKRMAALANEIAEARAELINRARDRRAIERLRERRYNAWRADNAEAQQREIDELASQSRSRSYSP